MRHRVCFIDDDAEFEVPLFREVFGEAFDVVAAASYAELRSRIESREGWSPDLFVLDLYFPSGEADAAAVDALRADPPAVEDDRAEIRAAYGNFLRARRRLRRVLDAWRQGPAGGLKLAGQVAADFPDVPIVFYSRKATFEDVVRCLAAGNVRTVERKPTGRNDAETRRLTVAEKDRLLARFHAAISRTDPEALQRLKHAARAIVQSVLQAPTFRP
jgi:CheY-like chemotaxis protein